MLIPSVGELAVDVQIRHKHFVTVASFTSWLASDVDYCQLSEERCPAHSTCHCHGNGDYRCTCENGWLMDQSLELCVRQGDEEDGVGEV